MRNWFIKNTWLNIVLIALQNYIVYDIILNRQNYVNNPIFFIAKAFWLVSIYTHFNFTLMKELGFDTPVVVFKTQGDVWRYNLTLLFFIPFIGPIIGYLTIKHYYKLYESGYKHIYPKLPYEIRREEKASEKLEKLEKEKDSSEN
jgi:hypothetical protein